MPSSLGRQISVGEFLEAPFITSHYLFSPHLGGGVCVPVQEEPYQVENREIPERREKEEEQEKGTEGAWGKDEKEK